jgi:hypothetical protein
MDLNAEREIMDLRVRIEQELNRASAENASNTPDFVLAEFLTDCLAAFDRATTARDNWYGMRPRPGNNHANWFSDEP